ncbi:MAG: hypothetical protein A4E52_00316 [Pelotomaculum sp. PtaB.Bin013]|uniref:Uncharacterized protein n=1 Tax=Pelotomaculum isophthalicicum JI TaxID=947010 RepID=A0A9X4GZY8_9FIRM|nr:hypothetical protein [Pelotomaculum isophthalicicum]MDF9409337.1 hypothetical protein [Pelotomaculum isophthalicicum JI]OPX91838.1 MAG: hypothetical protein A4E52_00316 [Pelotomaculum sp. PtaB.Bin013]
MIAPWKNEVIITGGDEIKKWRNLALAVTVLGIIVFSLPWIPSKLKFFSAVPLYIIFVYVYYRYICLKKRAASGNGNSLNKGSNGKEGVKKIDCSKDGRSQKRNR